MPCSRNLPVVPTEDGAHAGREARHHAAQRELLEQRYDLSDRPASGVTMLRGKPVQEGVRVILPDGVTWKELASMSPADIRDRDLFPRGFLPLPHANHPEGGMVFPQFEIDEVKRQCARPHALRSRFRHPRSLPAGVPAADLPTSATSRRARSCAPFERPRHRKRLDRDSARVKAYGNSARRVA
jgi:cytochrome c peroxidase